MSRHFLFQRSPTPWRVTSTGHPPIVLWGCYRPATPRCFKKRQETPTRYRYFTNNVQPSETKMSFKVTVVWSFLEASEWTSGERIDGGCQEGGAHSQGIFSFSLRLPVFVLVGQARCWSVSSLSPTGSSGQPCRTERLWDFWPAGFPHLGKSCPEMPPTWFSPLHTRNKEANNCTTSSNQVVWSHNDKFGLVSGGVAS